MRRDKYIGLGEAGIAVVFVSFFSIGNIGIFFFLFILGIIFILLSLWGDYQSGSWRKSYPFDSISPIQSEPQYKFKCPLCYSVLDVKNIRDKKFVENIEVNGTVIDKAFQIICPECNKKVIITIDNIIS